MTIQQLRDVYINNRSTYCSTDTILKYTDDLDLFFRFLESHYRVDPAVSSFDALTGSVYMDFILELRTRKIKNSSIRSYCRSVKAFLHWTYENNFSPDYLKGVKLPMDDAVAELPLFVEDPSGGPWRRGPWSDRCAFRSGHRAGAAELLYLSPVA